MDVGLLSGLANALTLANIGFALIGCLLGTLVGILPGLGRWLDTQDNYGTLFRLLRAHKAQFATIAKTWKAGAVTRPKASRWAVSARVAR